jgi:uncharacterized protein
MMILALVLGLDPLYVGTHHVLRFLAIAVVLPLVYRAPAERGSERH